MTLMTLRQALELLEREHLITRRHGLGHVRRRALHRLRHPPAPPVRRRSLGARASTSPRGCWAARFAAADRRVAGGAAVCRPRRARARARAAAAGRRPSDEPAALVPRRRRIGEEVVRADLAPTPLRQVARVQARRRRHARAARRVSAVRLGRREARELGCRAGAPAFESERVSYDAGGAAGRLRPRLHPGRPLPDHPRTPLRRSVTS